MKDAKILPEVKCPHCQNDNRKMIEVHMDNNDKIWLFCLVCAKAWWG